MSKPLLLAESGASRACWPRFAYSILPARHLPHPRHPHIATHAKNNNFFDNVFQGLNQLAGNAAPSTDPDNVDEEAGKFVQLDPTSQGSVDGSSEGTFGPLAILAVGFLAHEYQLIEAFLADIGADDVSLVPCTPPMLKGSLGEALLRSVDPPDHAPPVVGTSRVLFLSGMYAAEVMEVVGGYKEDGLPDAVFAAAVPKSWDRNLADLIRDVSEDHAKVVQRRAAAALEAAQAAQEGQGPG